MDFWSTSWGDVVTAAGLGVSLGGFVWAIKVARGARSASEAAKVAANESRGQIARHLQTVDLQRAIALINHIKTLHENDRWEASSPLYQTVREMLSNVITRCPQDNVEKLATARANVSMMENSVRGRNRSTISKSDQFQYFRILNEIQSHLEELASEAAFGDSQGETT